MKKFLLSFIAVAFLTIGLSLPSLASASTGEIPYSVKPILPKNQDEGITRYISISPDSNTLQQELEFLITNKSDKELTLEVEKLNAYTSANGGIQYSAKKTENNLIIDKKFEMQQYLQAPDKVILKGGESKAIKLTIDIPNIEGTILGGIAFKGIEGTEKKTNSGISLEIKNKVNTVYGVVINFPTDKKPAFDFGQAYLDMMPSYYVMRLPITLNSPVLVKDISLEYEVDLKGKKLFSSKGKLDYAPMTMTNFAVPFEHDEIVKNKPYTLKGKISYLDQNGDRQVQEFKKEIRYKEKNEDSHSLITNLKRPIVKNGPVYWLIPLALLPLIIFFVFHIYRRKKKSKDTDNVKEMDPKREGIS
ncbi:WxL protein peptidoglycan domain-containing protein [Bacillus massiliglaciei]|uniref:WxL protein peptidoglycan domain-containing protein n=1 Tax=Bacillus massiliglaciei TaxID=1816693 RepID=UPI000DA6174B|nr:DUF916 domain-containing protein [Bacillus massiliglaciei]